MKKVRYIVLLISALLLVSCQMPFPENEETYVTATAVSPDATPLPDGSGSTDPNAGGGGPNMPPPTDEPNEPAVEPTEESAVVIDPVVPTTTAVLPTATAVPPTIAPTAAPTETAVPPTDVPDRSHTVAPGENLYRISLQYGLSWTEVADANGISDPDSIVVGQTLIIPGGETTDAPVSGAHVVQANENLHYIGLLYGLPWTVIAEANGITDPNGIHAGQVLIIPME